MRKESDVKRIFADERDGILKKGTRITSIFEKLTILSHKRTPATELQLKDKDLTENEDDKHISFSAEGSETPEPGSVTIREPEQTCDDAEPGAAGRLPGHLDPVNDSGGGRDFALSVEAEGRREFIEPAEAPEFLRSQMSEGLAHPSSERDESVRPADSGEPTPIEDKHEAQAENNNFERANEQMNGQEQNRKDEYHDTGQGDSHDDSFPREAEAEPVLTLSKQQLEMIESPLDLVNEIKRQSLKPTKFLKRLDQEDTLRKLQAECVKLQQSVWRNKERVIVIFEGMELSGKHDTIRKFTKYMNPRRSRIVSLERRSADESSEWYFQRYVKHLPKPGEIVFFNRSWYDRGVLEPVHGLCTEEEYGQFLHQAPEFEFMLIENGMKIIKIWLSISSEKQAKRFKMLDNDPLRDWKTGPFDEHYLERWSDAAKYRNMMFSWTHKDFSPWVIVAGDKRKRARKESIRYVLSTLDYQGKEDAKVSLMPDAQVVKKFHRSMITQS
ncbi:MAG: hypothetical protein OEM82_08030 [Acidobacteriota bacterium]|nr:hypothetical protein [Acidobacteriota bacterium]MDH3528266.1 hypothetical protein [Acidobacteriota bacterium]